MFFKNTNALQVSADVGTGADADTAVLRALAGMACTVCDRPLGGPPPARGRQRGSYNAPFACCHRAYCPFCGAEGGARCAHLVAYRAGGDWRIAGLPAGEGLAFPPVPPSAGAIIGHSEAQKREAFRGAFGLLERLMGKHWDGRQIEKIPCDLIVDLVARPDKRVEVRTAGGAQNIY